MATVTIRYWAAAKEAAGVAAESCEAGTLAEALAAALARRDGDGGDRLRGVLARSSFLVDGAPAGVRRHEDISLAGSAVIEVLPPFAGG
ncbi:MAG TPA: MoaD/ThiS family protein [Streptosporangiaceae bacterium]|jgi:molybdopterin synthase sulfur carrier subunit|nr:MoaD/ThiS family protein [Streptosporangiaceae bacterium]